MPDTVFPYDDEVTNPYDDEVKNPHEESGDDSGGAEPAPDDADPPKRRSGRPKKKTS